MSITQTVADNALDVFIRTAEKCGVGAIGGAALRWELCKEINLTAEESESAINALVSDGRLTVQWIGPIFCTYTLNKQETDAK